MSAIYLYNNFQDFQDYAGGSVNRSVSLEAIEPSILYAAQRHIIPWIGNALWTQLVQSVATNAVTTAEDNLLDRVKRALAFLSVYEYVATGAVQLGDGGLYRIETESTKTAYKYQHHEFKAQQLKYGMDFLEQLINFLDENENDYPDWTDGKQLHRSLLLNTAAAFRNAYSYYIDRYTFECLRPLAIDLQQWALIPLMGEEAYEDFLNKWQTKAPLNLVEKEALRRIQRVIATCTIKEGINRHMVRLNGPNVVEFSTPDTIDPTQPPSRSRQPALEITLRQEGRWFDNSMTYLEKWLIDHPTEFPLFAAFKEAQAAATAATNPLPDNGRYSDTYRFGELYAPTQKKKGIFNL